MQVQDKALASRSSEAHALARVYTLLDIYQPMRIKSPTKNLFAFRIPELQPAVDLLGVWKKSLYI